MALSAEIRKLALDDIKAAGGVEHTRNVVKELQAAVETSLSLYEAKLGTKNSILRLVQKKLELDDRWFSIDTECMVSSLSYKIVLCFLRA